VSLIGWFLIPAIPLAGFLVERFGRPNLFMASAFTIVVLAAVIMPLVDVPLSSFWHYRAGDLCPGRIDHGPPRSGFAAAITGWRHGVFFTFYYIGMAILPGGAGLARDLSGSPSAPALFAAIMMLLCLLGLALFNAAKRMKRT
jgi:hypothetical protein